jgi:hypothetical protein
MDKGKLTYYGAEIYRIAEEVHMGRDDEYIKELCREVAAGGHFTPAKVYNDVRYFYFREFAN